MTDTEQESQNSSKGEQNQSSREVWIIKTKILTESSKVSLLVFCILSVYVFAGEAGAGWTAGHLGCLNIPLLSRKCQRTYSKWIDSKQKKEVIVIN